jgi:hypothetical protein
LTSDVQTMRRAPPPIFETFTLVNVTEETSRNRETHTPAPCPVEE